MPHKRQKKRSKQKRRRKASNDASLSGLPHGSVEACASRNGSDTASRLAKDDLETKLANDMDRLARLLWLEQDRKKSVDPKRMRIMMPGS